MNHSNALEATEETLLLDSALKKDEISGISSNPTEIKLSITETNKSSDSGSAMLQATSPTIPIPTTSKRNQLNAIDCEIGSKISTDEADLLEAAMSDNLKQEQSTTPISPIKSSSDQQTQYQISDMAAESIIWLSHRLGPVLTARHLTRNLLKMLTLCYVGQENLLPDLSNDENIKSLHDNLYMFTVADGRVFGDRNAIKVLECLTSIAAVYGDHFILLQYFAHITELVALCKKRVTPSLEGGLISSLQLLKYIVPCLSDTVIMDQLHVSVHFFFDEEEIDKRIFCFPYRTGYNSEKHYSSDYTLCWLNTFHDAEWIPFKKCIGKKITRCNLCVSCSNWT